MDLETTVLDLIKVGQGLDEFFGQNEKGDKKENYMEGIHNQIIPIF